MPAAMIGVMTDFGVHDFLEAVRAIDRYCIAHESVVASIADMFPHAREIATGVPLMPGFAYTMSAGGSAPSSCSCRRKRQ
jgi:hypothetical protein